MDKTTETQILDLVRIKPRTIQEIAQTIQKNWRTADRYVETLASETGHIAVRTFRGGTRGALKVVYWNAIESAKGSAYQQRLLNKIQSGRKKEDFSPFDIYQFVPEDKRLAVLQNEEFPNTKELQYSSLFKQAQNELLFFSGNLSWLDGWPDAMKYIEQLAKKRIRMKIVTRVDITSRRNVEKLLAVNQQAGWDAIEIRHAEQPLRALIIDNAIASFKEVINPQQQRTKELKDKAYLYYKLTDTEWIAWLQKVFWHIFSQSVDAQTRLDALDSVK
jgi:hypothetical protein